MSFLRLNYLRSLLLFFVIIGLCSCAGNSKHNLYKKLSKEDPKHLSYSGSYKVGGKYKVKNQTYSPQKITKYKEVGIASWYGPKFHGKKTANGEKYNKYCLSAAHRSLPIPSLVKVTNLKNNKSVIVLVNDRGPFSKNRIIDVSQKTASLLDFMRAGTAKVRVEYLAQETNKFLYNAGLKAKNGSKVAKNKKPKSKCSINCQVKLVNMKYKFPVN